jgi:uncharacterized protein YicC (UPF0701 family)
VTLTQDHADTTRSAESVFTHALEGWRTGLETFTTPLLASPSTGTTVPSPRFDAARVVELQFAFIERVLDVNHEYARQLAEATNTVSGAVRQHLEGLRFAAAEHVHGVTKVTQSGVESLQDSVRETAAGVERAQREAQQRAVDAAREQYRSLSKNELADEAAKRDLPKTGTVDELIDRLVQDDAHN